MTIAKKLIVYILVVALVLSLAGCGNAFAEPTVNPSPDANLQGDGEFPEGMEGGMPFGDGAFSEDSATTDPTVTTAPSSGANVVVKAEMSDAYGVYLYSYDSSYTSSVNNYVIIRMDEEELLSKDLFIVEVDLVSYSGEADFDDEDIIPEIDDEIQINQTTMKTLFAEDYLDAYTSQTGYFVALARDEDGDYYKVEYSTSNGWQTVDDSTPLDSEEELYIGLPLQDSGTYEVDVTFEIKDSEDAYQFGYFEKEIEDGITFTLTGDSKISKIRADIYVKSYASKIYTTDADGNDVSGETGADYQIISQYTLIDSSVDDISAEYSDLLTTYLTAEVDGETDEGALSEFVNLVEISDVYAYVYNEDTIYTTSVNSTDRYLILSENSDLEGKTPNEDYEIEEGDLLWVNYEFTIYDGGEYVISSQNALSAETAIKNILSIDYDTSTYDFTDGIVDEYENSDLIEQAKSTYNSLSTSQKAYLVTFTNQDILDVDSNDDDTDNFVAWCTYQGIYTITGYELVSYLEDAEDFLDELEVVEAFETVLDNYDLWSVGKSQTFTAIDGTSYTTADITNIVDFNSGSTIMVDNLETVLTYLDEMDSDDLAIIVARAKVTYDYLLYCESKVVSSDVENVMADISALALKYVSSDLTNTLLYVDLNADLSSDIGLMATHVIYSTSLFTSINYVLDEYYDLAPEKQDMLKEYTFELINSTESISEHQNYYYFSSEIIESGSASESTLEITYANALFALEEMMDVAINLNTLFSYIDYMEYFDTDIEKDRYVDLIFGDSYEGYNDLIYGNRAGLFDYDASLDDEERNENWAILDLSIAYQESDEVKEAIIEEYIQFIELLIYIQEYKYDIAGEFEEAMYEEISTDNDYSSKTVSKMESVLEDYIDAIMEEDTDIFSSDALIDVINYIFSEGFEDIDEAKDMIEDCFDVDEMVEEVIKLEGYTQE